MGTEYRATARLNDGRMVEATGTIAECAAWSENVIRSNQGQIEIRIMQIMEGQK